MHLFAYAFASTSRLLQIEAVEPRQRVHDHACGNESSEWFVVEREANSRFNGGFGFERVNGGDNPRSSCSADDVRPRDSCSRMSNRVKGCRTKACFARPHLDIWIGRPCGDSVQQQSAVTGKDQALCALVSKGVEARDVNDVP